MRYVFGDGELASRRLRLVAEVFAPSTAAFVADAVREAPGLVADLGCGPGHSTHQLAALTRAARTVGLDRSAAFIAAAARSATRTVNFLEHDVTQLPFPLDPLDLAFCRFLLIHLADPAGALAGWATQLRPGGLLVIDEVESIETSNPILTAYLGIVEELLAEAGGRPYAGPVVEAVTDIGSVRKRSSRVAHLAVPSCRAAAMFSLNLATWGNEAAVRERHGRDELERLAAALASIAASPGQTSDITWRFRQIVFERI